MSEFRTIVPMPQRFPAINYGSRVLSIGSCFAETIGERFRQAKFDIELNPSGILYNPYVIGRLISRLMSDRAYHADELFLHNGLWHSFAHHSRFSGLDQGDCLVAMNDAFQKAVNQLKQATHLMVTLGTAHVYEWDETGVPVSNCHKIPSSRFTKRLLNVQEMFDQWKQQLTRLFDYNKNLELIITISPIRHLKDGLHQNNLSKASLLLFVEQLCRHFSNVHYFPAYEIVMDELRDYRFYNKDMAHPAEVTIDYIWQQFTRLVLERDTHEQMQAILKIRKALAHRPFQQDSPQHQAFLVKQREKLSTIAQQMPNLDWSEEKELLNSQILN